MEPDSLRSQISKIEQDVFLFSRTLGENIAFGCPDATQEQIEQAAREAQAHDFIMSLRTAIRRSSASAVSPSPAGSASASLWRAPS